MTDLKGKTVLITGASAGIGQAMAHKFSEAGARILVCARRMERLKELQKALSGEVYAFQLDVRDRQAVEAAIAGLPPQWREIDVLVNNAGLSRGLEKLHEGNPDGWDEMIDTNVKGLLYVSRA
ncbi:MAG: SDR family NAD(P)-dependent oxidoreductase, partial [Candidatus Zixiibacteriota bacterium]